MLGNGYDHALQHQKSTMRIAQKFYLFDTGVTNAVNRRLTSPTDFSLRGHPRFDQRPVYCEVSRRMLAKCKLTVRSQNACEESSIQCTKRQSSSSWRSPPHVVALPTEGNRLFSLVSQWLLTKNRSSRSHPLENSC